MWKTDGFAQDGVELWQTWKQQLIEKAAFFAVILIAAFATLAAASAGSRMMASAASAAYLTDTSFTLSAIGKPVVVSSGSTLSSLTVSDRDFTVTLASDEAATFRLGPNVRGHFMSSIGTLDTCEFYNGSNYLTLSGPQSITITPDDRICDSTFGDAEIVRFVQPNGGEAVEEGNEVLLLWQTSGTVSRVRIRLSTDGGLTYPTVIAGNEINDGVFTWTVPSMPTTTQARLKIEALGQQDVVIALDSTDAVFTVSGTAPEPTPTPELPTPAPYDPASATAAATDIGTDKGLQAATLPSGTVTCYPNSRIKGTSSSAVYYCGVDGKRYVFPNQRIHDSWYNGFAGVVTLTDEQLAAIPLGGNVTYRPGVRLVKITTDPKVYAVDAHGVLRWIPDEYIARALYGDDWNTKVDDLSDAFFINYTVGEPIE